MLQLLAILGVLPALLAMFVVDRADAKRPEPRSTLRRIALFGALSTIPAAVVELIVMHFGPSSDALIGAVFMALMAAVVEETGKGLVVRWFVWKRPEFDERTDGIVYGTRAGLGFALLENVCYLLTARSFGGFIAIFLMRAVLTVPMHATAGWLMGHYAAWRRFEGRGPGVLGGFALALAIHGGFAACILSLPTLIADDEPGLALLAGLGAVVIVIGGLVGLRRAWRTALTADDAASVRAGFAGVA